MDDNNEEEGNDEAHEEDEGPQFGPFFPKLTDVVDVFDEIVMRGLRESSDDDNSWDNNGAHDPLANPIHFSDFSSEDDHHEVMHSEDSDD
eukprot:TRINITY_DN44091_c0_g1_i1.p1 TRINITY_DN44091_c0_g1~~TRINITY_DN44091_c0_g1_i1.p1  ORF type:complete len:103 (-),score=38.90 TRINITY_DN44091_c0_g1_i1:69-338(-)